MSDQFKADVHVPERTTAEPRSAPATIHYLLPMNELPVSPPGGALAVQGPTEASDTSPRIEAPAAASVETKAEPGPASLTIPDVGGSARRALVTLPSPAHTELLRIGDRISPSCAKAFRVLFQNPPCVLGQAIADYYELAVVALDEFIPQNYREVALLKQIVDEEWKVLTFGHVQTALLNAAIAAGLVERLCDSGGDNKEQLRQWRQVVFAAVSGDVEMRAKVEDRVGPIGFDAFAAERLRQDIRVHVFTDNVMSAASKRRNSAIRQLEEMQEARYKTAVIRSEQFKAVEAGDQWHSFRKTLTQSPSNPSPNTNAAVNRSSADLASSTTPASLPGQSRKGEDQS